MRIDGEHSLHYQRKVVKLQGLLFDFVTRAAAEALELGVVHVAETREALVLESTGENLDVDVLTLSEDGERQVALLNTLDAAPVAIDSYVGDRLAMEIRVLDYQVNGAFDEAWFVIPEQ